MRTSCGPASIENCCQDTVRPPFMNPSSDQRPQTGQGSSPRRHLAVFLPSLEGGGAERVVATLVNELAHRNYRVDLVLASATGPYLSLLSPQVRVIDLKVNRIIRSLLPLAGYLREARPEAMLSAMAHANVVALVARRLSNVRMRLVVAEHSTISQEQLIATGFSTRLVFKLVPILYPWADAVCTVSKAAAMDLTRFLGSPGRTKVATIYNPFDIRSIEQQSCEPLDHPWFRAGQAPVIVGMGRLNEAKDFHVLIQAFAKLRARREARLLILGEGELRKELQTEVDRCQLSPGDVQMPGFVPNPYAYLSCCDLFVLSSRREALPGALIEAMICGAPVISTDCASGPQEILEGGRWGRLVAVGDVAALSEAMFQVLSAPRATLPDTRRRGQDFDVGRSTDEYLGLLGL